MVLRELRQPRCARSPDMVEIYLVIRDEGDYSDREWTVEAVCSTVDKALARACSLAASHFVVNRMTWELFHHPFVIQTWTIDGTRAAGETEVTRAQIRQRHPDLTPLIAKREKERAARIKLQEEARVRAVKEQERRSLDDLLRNRTLTVEQYYEAVAAVDAKSAKDETDRQEPGQ